MIAIVHYTNDNNQFAQAILIGCETEQEAIERTEHFIERNSIDRIDIAPSDKIIVLTGEDVSEQD